MTVDEVEQQKRQETREVVKEGVVSAVKDIGATLKEKWQQGLVELSNALYQESGIAVPPVISQSQLERDQIEEMQQYVREPRAREPEGLER